MSDGEPDRGDAAAAHELLGAGLRSLGLDLPANRQTTLLDYLAMLARWNRAYNLTAVRGTTAMVQRHLLESLSLLPHLRSGRILDVGSGAGLPGMVLAIAAPEHRVWLLDPSLKRTRFLTQAVHDLRLANAQVVRGRLESLAADVCFDEVVSRATMSASRLVTQAQRVLCPGGRVLAMLGRQDDELAASLGAQFRVTQMPLQVPAGSAHRHLACIEQLDAAAGSADG